MFADVLAFVSPVISPVRLVLWLHIAFGFAAFAIAPVALVTRKGGAAHRRWGRAYFWAMSGVAATALVLSAVLPILFLALVAIFSFYAAFAAYRVLYLKDLASGGRPKTIDCAAGLVTLIGSLTLGVLGILAPSLMGIGVVRVAGRPVSVVAVAFGIVGVALAVLTMRHFVRRPREKMFWWYAHMQGMLASYVAAWSAFSAVNLTRVFGPVWWVWLWPTLLGTPAIVIWITYYKLKFNRRTATASPVVPTPAV